MISPRNDDIKKILRSLKNVKESQLNNSKNTLVESSSSSSSSSLNRIKTDKESIQNMIRSHPLLIDLNQSKDKLNDKKHLQRSIVEYDESSEDLKPNHSETDEEENLKEFNKDSNKNNNNCFNKNYSGDLSYNKKYCFKQKRADCTAPKTPTNCQQQNICNSEQVKKKFNRVNKIFYNGFINKQDNKYSNCPEYQAHASELLHFLKSLWLSNTMCDLSLVVGNRKYPAHRLGLAMFSRKYREEFQKKLLNNKDTGVYTICLKNSTNFAVESILKYMYTAKIDINPANVEEILSAAKELEIDDLVCMCNDYLSSLSIGDVLDYMGNILNKEGSELMFYELYAYMMTHLDKISRTPEFLKSSICVVNSLLGDSHLCVCNELEVFDAALRWLEYDKPNRFKYLYEIMKNIRFSLMTPDELVSKVEGQLNLCENYELFRLVYQAYKYHSLAQSKLNNFIKREESRNVCLKGASVPDSFVKSIIELSEIAHKLKATRTFTSNKLLD